MGDEMHQRNVGCTGLFLREIAPALARAVEDREKLANILAFIGGNDQFFLNLAMVMGKTIMDPARGVAGSSIVTAMSRNGTDFGIRVGGTGDTWFTAPVEMPRGLYFPGFSEADANPDMGDSTIVETVGLGGFAMAAAPGGGRLRRRWNDGRRAGIHARHVRDYRRAQPGLDVASARLCRGPHGNRRPKGGGDRHRTDHQHRHCPPQAGHGPGRRRRCPGANGLFRASPGSPGSGVDGGVSGPCVINRVRRAFYLDSVALMRLSRELSGWPGVEEAALMIGTPSNKEILDEAGLLADDGRQAASGDIIIALRAADLEAGKAALDEAEALLGRSAARGKEVAQWRPRSLASAFEALPGAGLALISVPGAFAAAEARKALRRGLHVLLFSNNVPLAEECALKEDAHRRGLLLMGPDCGTALISGTPLAFANRVRRGSIGIVSASGTGLQEVSSLIDRGGGGVSHGIGVGSRDLGEAVGGAMTLVAIDALDDDPETEHVVLLSKPPAPSAARRVLERIAESRKPYTVCFVGLEEGRGSGQRLLGAYPDGGRRARPWRSPSRSPRGCAGRQARRPPPSSPAGAGSWACSAAAPFAPRPRRYCAGPANWSAPTFRCPASLPWTRTDRHTGWSTSGPTNIPAADLTR